VPRTARFPDDLVDAYRRHARSRERDRLTPSPDAAADYLAAARAIRLHPFWRTLPAPADVAEAAGLLRAVSTLPSEDGENPVVPYLPLDKDPDAHTRRDTRVPPEARARYAARLEAAGMWDRRAPALRARERRNTELTGDGLRHGLNHRDRQFFADAEDLFERGVLDLLDELAPSLADCGLALDVAAVSDPYHPPPPGGEDAYVLELNGVRCEVDPHLGGRRPSGLRLMERGRWRSETGS
jgi:hypothetical protein